MMYLTGSHIINELAVKPAGQKGGTAVKFKESKLPEALRKFGHSSGLLEGWQMDEKALFGSIDANKYVKGLTAQQFHELEADVQHIARVIFDKQIDEQGLSNDQLKKLTQEMIDLYVPIFNTATYSLDIIGYVEGLYVEPGEAAEGFLKKFYQARREQKTLAMLRYNLIEKKYRMQTQSWELDKTLPALQPTNLAGMHTWLGKTLYVEVPTCKLGTRFEPLKENVTNFIMVAIFLFALFKSYTRDAYLKDVDIKKAGLNQEQRAFLEYLLTEKSLKLSPHKTLRDALKAIEVQMKDILGNLNRVEEKNNRRYIDSKKERNLTPREKVAFKVLKRYFPNGIGVGAGMEQVDNILKDVDEELSKLTEDEIKKFKGHIPMRSDLNNDSGASSARTRPGKTTPTKEQAEATLGQIKTQGLSMGTLSSIAISNAVAELKRQGLDEAAGLLQRISAPLANQIHAPPVMGVFENIFGTVYFENGILDEAHLRIFISQDIAAENHPENLLTIVHEAVEAYWLLKGLTIEKSHEKALEAEIAIGRLAASDEVSNEIQQWDGVGSILTGNFTDFADTFLGKIWIKIQIEIGVLHLASFVKRLLDDRFHGELRKSIESVSRISSIAEPLNIAMNPAVFIAAIAAMPNGKKFLPRGYPPSRFMVLDLHL